MTYSQALQIASSTRMARYSAEQLVEADEVLRQAAHVRGVSLADKTEVIVQAIAALSTEWHRRAAEKRRVGV